MILVSAFAAVGLAACHDDPEPTPPQKKALRTVLVYQVANNNLGTASYNEMDIAEMKAGAAQGKLPEGGRLLVYNAGPSKPPYLLDITANGIDTLKTYDQSVLSVQSERMLEVFDDVERFAPADDNAIILWSHGSGWLQDGMEDPNDTGVLPKSFGSEKGKTMNITTLANTLRQGPEWSFVYFDCCYMASVETLYELRHIAPVIVGSATELLVYGMPYDQNIPHFFAPTPDLVGAASTTFALYDAMTGSNRTCTMSVVNTDGLDKLAKATKAIYELADPHMPADYVPQRFMNKGITNCHYFDFRQYVGALCTDAAGAERFAGAAALLADFDAALADCVGYAAATPMLWNTVPLTFHCGMSTFILDTPEKANNKNYKTLSWYADVASALDFQ